MNCNQRHVDGLDARHLNPYATRSYVQICLALLCATLLSACTGSLLQSKVDEPQVYTLRPAPVPAAASTRDVELAVGLPTAIPALDTTRIAVVRAGNQLDYFFGARWGGTAPQVVQTFIVTLLQSQHAYKSALADNSRVDPDYILDIELRDFQAEYSGPANADAAPVIHVNLLATLIDVKSRATVGQLQAFANVTATDNRLSTVATAFQSALQQTSISLAEQLTASLEKR